MNLREVAKKTLCTILFGAAIAIGAQNISLPEGYEFFDKTKYHRFENFVTATKIYNKNKVGWLVYNTKEKDIVGNSADEIDEYQKYAEMAQSKELMESLTADDVRNMASLYARGLAGYEIAYKIPNFVLEKGSNLEGRLLDKIMIGGLDLPNDTQKEIVKKLIEEEKKEIVDEFYKKIFGDEEVVNPIKAANKAKNYLLNTIEARLIGSSFKLNRAAEILEKGRRQELSYDEYREFLDNFIEGNSTGRAYLNAIDRIRENVNIVTLTQKIVKNMSKGMNLDDDIEKISMQTNDLLNVDLAGFLFGDGDFMDVFNDVEKEYLAERGRLFKILEGKYNLKEGTISASIIRDLDNFKLNKKEEEVIPKKDENKEVKKKPEKLEKIVKKEEPKKELISKDKINTIKREICLMWKYNTNLSPEESCKFKEVDLNNDGKLEVILKTYPWGFEDGKFALLIFQLDENNYFNILEKSFVNNFEISKNKTYGYYDIITSSYYHKSQSLSEAFDSTFKNIDSGCVYRDYIFLKWNGKEYEEIEKKEEKYKDCDE